MNQDIIERYIYAVTKRMPSKTAKDVAAELRTLIADMLEERCGEDLPSEKDIKVVLTELGTPAELYEQYTGDGKKCLIGQPYYTTYIYVMKIVLACTALGMTIVAILELLTGSEIAGPLQGIAQWLGMLWQGLLSAFAFVTLLFAFFYHKEIPIDTYSGLENLPAVPGKKERISKVDPILGIGISILFLIVFLVCPQIFCVIMTETKELIPIFNTEVIRATWYIIVLFSILGIFREIMKLLDGKYTKRVVITSVITDLLSGVCTIWWLLRKDIMNPEFIRHIDSLFKEESTFIQNIFANFQYFFMGVILFALIIDIIDSVVGGRIMTK